MMPHAPKDPAMTIVPMPVSRTIRFHGILRFELAFSSPAGDSATNAIPPAAKANNEPRERVEIAPAASAAVPAIHAHIFHAFFASKTKDRHAKAASSRNSAVWFRFTNGPTTSRVAPVLK